MNTRVSTLSRAPHRSGRAIAAVVAASAAFGATLLATLAGTRSPLLLSNCPTDPAGNVYPAYAWMPPGSGAVDDCGDANGDGEKTYEDFPAFWEESKQCPNFPTTITPETIIGNQNLIPQQCGVDLCAHIAAGAASVFQSELGRMPTSSELGQLDGLNGPGTGVCDPPTSVPEMPGGPGPIYCSGIAGVCDIPIIDNSMICPEIGCGDILLCAGINCDFPDFEVIEIPEPGNKEPWPGPPDEEGDPSWGPGWFPPGYDPQPEPEEPPSPPEDIASADVVSGQEPPADDTAKEAKNEVIEEEDDEPKEEEQKTEKKDCDGEGSGDKAKESDGGGSSVESSAPVSIAYGQKTESVVDVAVRLTGRDFSISRTYTSELGIDGPHLVGNNWSLSSFAGVFAGPSGILRVYEAKQNRVVPFSSDGNGGWSAIRGRQRITRTYLSTGEAVYRLTEPGAGARFYYRELDSEDPPLYPANHPAKIGLLAQEVDTYGNTVDYHYDLFGGSSTKKARLRRIVLNDSSSVAEAEIRFQWYLVGSSVTHPLNGKLARVQVVRFDANGDPYETDRVEYTYKHPGDPFPDDLGTDGDLIQVVRFSRVDNWVDDGSDYAPAYPHRSLITQYRYHDGTTPTSSDPRLAVSGSERQLKSVFNPEQIEYYAQKLHRSNVLAAPSVAVRDAAFRLMLRGDADLAFTDESSNARKAVDVAAKIIGYDTTGRVGVQYLQSACGCSGSIAQGIRQTFTYSEWTANSLWPRGGRATQIEEHLYDSGSYSQLYRTLYYDMAPQGSTSTVPYIVNSVTKDTQGRHWIWHYRYDSERRIAEKFTPAAMSQSYTPAAGTTASVYSTLTSGLVFVYSYNAQHRAIEMGMCDGDGGTVETITSITYPGSDGTNTRTYLPTRIDRFTVAGSPTADQTQTTWYEYGFHGSATTSHVLAWKRTIAERELPSENGPETGDAGATLFTPPGGSGAVVVADTYDLYDQRGRLVWTRFPDWSLRHREYDSGVARPTAVTLNADRTGINTTIWSLSTTGWGFVDGGSTRLPGGAYTLEYDYNGQGRLTAMRSPGGVERTITREFRPLDLDQSGELPGIYYFVKRGTPHQLTQTPNTYAGTETINWFNAAGRVVSRAEFTLDTNGGLVSPPVGRRTLRYTLAGKLERERSWHDIAQDAYYDTSYTYDALGRTGSVTYPNSTVMLYDSYDALGRVLQVSMGRVGASAVPVAAYFYDDPDTDATPEQGVGNGNLSWTVRYAGEDRVSGDSGVSPTSEIRTFRLFDYRNRIRLAQSPEAPHFAATYDNLGRPVEIGLFTSVPSYSFTTLPTTDRAVYVKYGYSQRGNRFRTLFATDPQNPTAFLGEYSWLDAAGRPLAMWEPNSHRTKIAFDGLGRATTVWMTDGTGDPAPGASNNHAAAIAVADDIVLEQVELRYDSRGRGDLLAARVRLHDSTATGTLTDTSSVATYDATYFDDANRPIRSVAFGTNHTGFRSGGTSPASSWPPSSPPNWNDTGWEERLISAVEYDARGFPVAGVSPEGFRTESGYDALGRAVWTIENANGGSVAWSGTLGRWVVSGMSSTDSSLNRATTFVYGFDSNGAFTVQQLAHTLDSSSQETVQVTQYEYGTSLGTATNVLDSLIATGHLLSKVRLPDPDTGTPGGASETITYAYDRQGELRALQDQNGTVHAYTRDLRSRVVKDLVAAFGTDTSIDQWADQIRTRFDRIGRTDRVETLSGTTVLNAVEMTYTAMSQIQTIYQDANGPVVLGSGTDTRSVAYTYATSAADNYSRMSTLAYPNSDTLTYTYGSSGSTDSRISRIRSVGLSNLSSSVTDLVEYDYVGLAFTAAVDLPLIDVQLDRTYSGDGKRRIRGYTTQAQGVYPGWDRHGRVAQQVWADGALTAQGGASNLPTRPAILAELHTYARDGSRTASYDRRPGADRGDRDAEYEYDGLRRLKATSRGKRNESTNTWTAGEGSQAFDLDQLGNWKSIKTDLDGNGAYTGNYETENRDHNALNQLVERQLTAPPSQPIRPLAYDAAGNLKSHEKASGLTAKYSHDAWGRLTKVRHQLTSSTLDRAEYQYNGLHWRTRKRTDTGTDGVFDEERRMYYSAAWQLLQEDIDGDGIATNPTKIDRSTQHFWGRRYIDDIVMHRTREDGVSGHQPSYFHITDLQFSTVAILDDSGKLMERTRYHAYGQGDFRWPGDFDRDGDVDKDDDDELTTVIDLAPALGDPDYEPDLDLDRDGEITEADYAYFYEWFGKTKAGSGAVSDGSGPANSIGFSGQYLDNESFMYNSRFRYYDPLLGRFISKDPAGFVDGPNLYARCGGMPHLLDPTGLATSDEISKGVAWISFIHIKVFFQGDYLFRHMVREAQIAAQDASLLLNGGRAAAEAKALSDLSHAQRAVRWAGAAAKVTGYPLAALSVYFDAKAGIDAALSGDYSTASINASQVTLGAVALYLIATGNPAAATVGIAILIIEAAEHWEVAQHLGDLVNDAGMQVNKMYNTHKTCEFLATQRAYYSQKSSCDQQNHRSQIENIEESWKSRGCS